MSSQKNSTGAPAATSRAVYVVGLMAMVVFVALVWALVDKLQEVGERSH
jgi:hypothetical protein